MRPQGRKDVPEVGIFACRCPWRPNPIGMTTVKVIERNGNILKVKGLDVLDGHLSLISSPILLRMTLSKE